MLDEFMKIYNAETEKEESKNYDDNQHFIIESPTTSSPEIREFAKFSFVVTNEEMHVSYPRQKDLILNALYGHPYLSKIGQIWQTLERGGM